MSNRTIMDLKQQLTVLDVEFARTSATLGPRHPAMVGLQQARDALKARLDLELQSVVAGARKSFETASALTASLRQKMHAFETEAGTAEDEESSIADLLRALETKKARYADLTREITRLPIPTRPNWSIWRTCRPRPIFPSGCHSCLVDLFWRCSWLAAPRWSPTGWISASSRPPPAAPLSGRPS